MRKRNLRFWFLSMCLVLLAGLFIVGCPSVGVDELSDFDYETRPVLVTNPDWGVIPLPNNLLNPVAQAMMGISIPGVEAASEEPIYMALSIVDDEAATKAQDLGYDVKEDSDLSKALIGGMNKLDGFVQNFIVNIPFSKKLDLNSIKLFEAKLTDGVITSSNAEEANFFFLDITDPEKPRVIGKDDHVRIFDYAMNEQYPYYLTIRQSAGGIVPDDYKPGHTYAIYMTGIDETKGVKDIEGKPFLPDSTFSIFAATDEDRYIGEKGNIINNVLNGDLVAVQQAEGARQITNYAIKVWESVVGDKRSRNELVTAYSFTIVTNPYIEYFNAVAALGNNVNAFMVSPIDYVLYDDDNNMVEKTSGACKDDEILFNFSKEVVDDTVNSDSIKLYKVESDDSLTEVELDITLTDSKKFSAVAKSALIHDSTYVLAANNKIESKITEKSENQRPAIDQSYFGLTRVDTKLVEGGKWLSPHLDSRIDSLLASGNIGMFGDDRDDFTDEERSKALEGSSAVVYRILSMLEAMRVTNAKYIPQVVESGFVSEREDIVVFWTFTTDSSSACGE